MSNFGRAFQLQTPFSSYYWEDPSTGYIDHRTYDLFNEMPQFSAVGKREVSAVGVYDAYGNVIADTPLLVPEPYQEQQLKDLQSQINAAQLQLHNDQSAANTAMAIAKKEAEIAGVPFDPTTYLADNGWLKIFDSDKAVIDKLIEERAGILRQYPGNQKVIDAWTTPPSTAATTDKAFLKCSINGVSYWRAIYEVRTPHDIVAMMSKGGQPMSFSLDSSKASSQMSKSWAKGSLDLGWFFGIYADGSWSKFDITKSSHKVTVSVNFDKVDRFPIKRGDWYDGGYLATLKKKDKWNPPYTAEKVFGDNGLLPLVSTEFFAAIGMSLTITVSQSAFEQHKEEFKASGGIQIGPFRFGGSGGHSTDTWHKEAENSEFTIKLTDEYPYIIGYSVARADGEKL